MDIHISLVDRRNLSTEVERKLAKNSDRIYETDARGVLNRADHTS